MFHKIIQYIYSVVAILFIIASVSFANVIMYPDFHNITNTVVTTTTTTTQPTANTIWVDNYAAPPFLDKLAPTGYVKSTTSAYNQNNLGICLDSTNAIWIGNYALGQVSHYDTNGAYKGYFQGASHCFGVCADKSNDIWVADAGYITRFVQSNGYSRVLYTTSQSMNGVCVDGFGNIWAAQQAAAFITRVSRTNNFAISSFASQNATYNVGICADLSNNIWQCSYNGYVSCYYRTNNYARTDYKVGANGDYMMGICIDSDNNIYAAGYSQNKIYRLPSNNRTNWTTHTTGSYPYGICSDNIGNIWVCNYGAGTGNTVTKFGYNMATTNSYATSTGPVYCSSGFIWWW